MWNHWLDSNTCEGGAVALYLGVFAAFSVACMALHSADQSGRLLFLPIFLVAIGLLVGFRLRTARRLRLLGLAVGVVVGAGTALLTPLGEIDSLSLDAQVAYSLVWLTIAISFAACSNDTVVFLLVPSVAMLIASVVDSPDAVLTGYTLVFCAAAVFSLLCHASSRGRVPERVKLSLRAVLVNHAALACLLFITTAALALVALAPFRLLGEIMRPALTGTSMALRRSTNHAGRAAAPDPSGTLVSPGRVKVGQGPAVLTHRPVMLARTSHAGLLLGRVYTQYMRDGWQVDENTSEPALLTTRRGFMVQPDPWSTRWPVVAQTLTLLVPMDVAPAMARVAAVAGQSADLAPRVTPDATLRNQDNITFPFTYEVVSQVSPPLDSLTPGNRNGYAPPLPERPLVTPDVAALATRLQGVTDIQTAQNIMGYLRAHCTYDLQASATPAGSDAVQHFLFSSHVGYCDLFATSTALLLQLDGIPARYCTGYAPGKWDPSVGAEIITSDDAHAWVQVFIRGSGWITIDPTPPGFASTASPGLSVHSILRRLESMDLFSGFPAWMITLAAALLAMALYGLFPAVRKRNLRRRWNLKPGESSPLLDFWTMERWFTRWGAGRKLSETPLEYAARFRALGMPAEVAVHVETIARCFTAARYGPDVEARDPESHVALTALRALLRLGETRRKVRAAIRRGLLPSEPQHNSAREAPKFEDSDFPADSGSAAPAP